MAFMTLRASNGKYVGVQSGTAPLSCGATEPMLFELLQLDDGKAMLKVPSTGRFVMVVPGDDGWCLPMAAEPGPQCLLRLVTVGDAVALQTPDGVHYLSAGNGETIVANATAIGDHERFVMDVKQDAADLLLMTRGCCGSFHIDDGPAIKWETGAHRKIVEKAIELLFGRGDLDDVKRFRDTYWTTATFQRWVFGGLWDADYKAPWSNNYWSSHFYNPVTGKNYDKSNEVTALTEGRRYFSLSQHVGARIWRLLLSGDGPGDLLYKHAGYYLGLSLHFLTDLTQPMHAANFTNIYGDEGNSTINYFDRRHEGFEIFGDDAIRDHGLVDDLGPLKDADLAPFTDAGSYLIEVAREAKKVFDDHLKLILARKADKRFHGIPEPFYRENFWRQKEAGPALLKTLRLAPLRVARYLVNWSRRVQTDLGLSSNRWYSILEPTKAPPDGDLDKFEVADLNNYGSVQRWGRNDGDNQKWFLHFNDDGTLCIGSRESKNYVWLMWNDIGLWWVGRGTSVDESATHFRAIPHDDKRCWIFEPTKNEAVTVKQDEPYPGYFIRWDPYDTGKQLFRFRDVGAITEAEKTEIKKHFPNFGSYNWWGAKGIVPKWEQNLGD